MRQYTIYAYNPEGLELDDCLQVLKEFRENLPASIEEISLTDLEVGSLQAMLNIIDYISIPEKLVDNAAEA